jgi:two-component system sensor histidine kinase BaeS
MVVEMPGCHCKESPACSTLPAMKNRLATKIFLAFFFSLAVIAALLVGMQTAVLRNFTEYVSRTELEGLGSLETRLIEIHERDGGWDTLRDNHRAWGHLLEDQGVVMHPPHPPPPHGDGFPGRPPLPPPEDEASRRARRGEIRFPPPGNPPPDRQPDPLRIGLRLSLFDADKHLIAGPRHPVEEFTLDPLEAGGRIIGWLGLHRMKDLPNPLAKTFLERQATFFYASCAAALILTALVTLLFSRQILGPVKAMTRGTRALISRRFDTRIQVRSKDELGQLARDFNTLAKTLEQYEASRKQWISDISHELRTPLAVLRGEIEALQDGVRKAEPETLSSLHAEAVRIGKLVEDLHLLSLADSEALLSGNGELDPAEVLRDTVRLFQDRMAERGLALDLNILEKPGARIEGNADRLKQVFSNLLENTLRYANTPGTLHISAFSEGKRVTVLFEDSGPGVPPESLPRLFDRLYRVEPSRSRELGGSGLGLSICKQIVEALDGEISAEHSALGGLCIRLTFPWKP